jgi:hypothetical protein
MYSDWDHGFYVAIIGRRYGRVIRHRCPLSWQGGQGERGGQVEMLCQRYLCGLAMGGSALCLVVLT